MTGIYDPSRVVTTIKSLTDADGASVSIDTLPGVPPGTQLPFSIVSGRGPDSHVAAARTFDTWSLVDGRYVRNDDRTGTIKLTVTDGAEANAVLSCLQQAQATLDFKLDIDITDSNATPPTVINALGCKLAKPADYEASTDDGVNTWLFLVADLTISHSSRAQRAVVLRELSVADEALAAATLANSDCEGLKNARAFLETRLVKAI